MIVEAKDKNTRKENKLNLNVNFAFGGAETGAGNLIAFLLPALFQDVADTTISFSWTLFTHDMSPGNQLLKVPLQTSTTQSEQRMATNHHHR